MITSEKIVKCANLNSTQLEELLRVNYPADMVISSKFIGITNGGEFCYTITFPDDGSKTGLGQHKVFVQMNDYGNLMCDY